MEEDGEVPLLIIGFCTAHACCLVTEEPFQVILACCFTSTGEEFKNSKTQAKAVCKFAMPFAS